MNDTPQVPVPAAGTGLVPTEGASVTPAVPAAPGPVRDAVHDLQQAWTAVGYLEAAGRAGDVSATLQAAIVCTGATAVEALQAATDFVRESPRVEVHSIAWARTPGPVEESWQYQATLLVSYPDQYGEFTGATHHAPVPPGRA
jgi:hypothetical protein